MHAMAGAGFDCVFVGIETPDEQCLSECNKLQNKGRDLLECVSKIQQAGIQVFCAVPGTVSENLEQAKAGALTEMSLLSVCSGHDHDGGCAH